MIIISNLYKSFGKLDVLKNITLQIPRGKITAIVGPNASGKTTMMKILLGLVKSDSGEIAIDNLPVNGHFSYREKIGYMPQVGKFPENLTVGEVIRLVDQIRNYTHAPDLDLYNAFQIGDILDKPVRTLSGGTRQKLSAIIAFRYYPQVLIFDEPTAGLDPLSSRMIKDKISEEKKNGKTMVLTSHIMSEIEQLADHVIFLNDGEVRYQGELSELREKAHDKTLERAIAGMMEGSIE